MVKILNNLFASDVSRLVVKNSSIIMMMMMMNAAEHSIIGHAEKGSASPDPVVLVDLAGQVKHQHEVS